MLREYALVADGFRGALIGPQGEVAWLCFPRWGDPAVFAELIGAIGSFAVTPVGRHVWGGYYEDGSLIWRSRWVTEEGILESRDALVYPGTAERAVLLRRVSSVLGRNAVSVTLRPATDYGRRPLGTWERRNRSWCCQPPEGTVSARYSVGRGVRVACSRDAHQLSHRLVLEEQQHHDLVLELVDGPVGDLAEVQPETAWRATEAAWRAAVPTCDDVVASADVRRSYAVLRGLTGPEGGTVAAATTSLPERARRGRNYDYRYVWTRDVCYIGHAGAALKGGEELLDDAVRWTVARLLANGPHLAPAYTDTGDQVPEERALDLPGYPGGADVVGNHVRDQFQLDVFGEALLLLAAAAGLDRLDAEGWRAAETALGVVEGRWRQPDAGVWELDNHLWTHSRLTCAAGIRAICGPGAGASPVLASRWLPLADAITADTAATSLHPTGHWQRAADDERVDAALLLAEIRGALPPDDPRSRATRAAILSELEESGYLYRYRHPGMRPGDAEGAFLICNFWMALACLGDGQHVEAVRWFERGRGACGPPGLFSEEFDVHEHQLRGNLPQAFVHALLIEAAAAQGAAPAGGWESRGRS